MNTLLLTISKPLVVEQQLEHLIATIFIEVLFLNDSFLKVKSIKGTVDPLISGHNRAVGEVSANKKCHHFRKYLRRPC